MKNILINASAAKTGGAETILRTFVDFLKTETNNKYIVLSPHQFNVTETHLEFITLETNGFKTIWFSILGIGKYVRHYKPEKIISFNNLNYIFKPRLGITYFHQPKALELGYADVKVKVYKFFITKFLRENTFIVQSQYIKKKFINVYSYNPKAVLSCWPGFIIPEVHDKYNNLNKAVNNGLLPMAYAAEHKNIELLNKIIPFFEDEKIQVTTLLEPGSKVLKISPSIINIGPISRLKMFRLYNEVNFLIFTSKDETVGLPIFEFLQTGKLAFVYAADYAKEFHKQFNEPENFILFENEADFKRLFLQHKDIKAKPFDYSKGEWNKILQVL